MKDNAQKRSRIRQERLIEKLKAILNITYNNFLGGQKMTENLTLTFSRKAKNVLIGKIILLIFLSFVSGYFTWKDNVHRYNEGKKITYAQYQKNFEKYKAEQSKDPGDLTLEIIIATIVIFFFVALYEAIGQGIGRLIFRLSSDKNKNKETM